jgi:hypothetical protein
LKVQPFGLLLLAAASQPASSQLSMVLLHNLTCGNGQGTMLAGAKDVCAMGGVGWRVLLCVP